MNLLEDSIKCTSCKEILKAPVILPCGHSICKHHENETVEIECSLCRKSYAIPPDGFVRVRALERLLEKKIETLDLGEEYNSARDNCKLFGDLLEHFNRIKDDPEMKVHTVISELKNKVDLRREELKGKIDKEATEMIEKLDEFEKECKASIKSDSEQDKKLERWENDFKQWQLCLGIFERNIEKWKTISDVSRSHLKEIQLELLRSNENLFLNRLSDLNYTQLFVSLSNFSTTSVEVKELSKYIDIKEEKKLICHEFKVGGIDWKLGVYIERYIEKGTNETILNENYIGVYLFPKESPIPHIMVEYDLVILDQLGMGKSLIKNCLKKFESATGYGDPKMVKLRDLIANYNVYNVKKDSFTVQVIIKKIEFL